MTGLSATVVPGPPAETAVVLRIRNDTGADAELPDPDLGAPAADSGWPHSVEAYRAVLLVSFGIMSVDVRDASGDEAERLAVSTWSTPRRRPDLVLAPGATLDLVIPLGPMFALSPGERYRVGVMYGGVTGEGEVAA